MFWDSRGAASSRFLSFCASTNISLRDQTDVLGRARGHPPRCCPSCPS
jgi:hypothetical protein